MWLLVLTLLTKSSRPSVLWLKRCRGGGEVLLLAETAVLNSAVFLSSAAAAASVALAAESAVLAAAAFAVLASGVQYCPRVDLQVQPVATQCPGVPR